jgi:hypothetical protein
VSSGGVVAIVSTDRDRVLLDAATNVRFGRDPGAELRIGLAPIYDDVVPRIAGRVFVVDSRVLVANADDRLAFDLRIEGRPLVSVPPGHWHSPDASSFDIVVTGVYSYELVVTANDAGSSVRLLGQDSTQGEDELPTGGQPRLTERQREILDAYVAPLQRGGSPASHQMVADLLGISRSLVRLECQKIRNELIVAGVPMRQLADARDEIADAWARHRI